MELEKLLRQLQSIKPDADCARRSRHAILGTSTRNTPVFPYLVRWVVQGFQAGSSVVLAILLFIVVVGGFSVWSAITPFNLASLDPKSLRAEAEAVDIQIQLAQIAYSEPARLAETTTPTMAMPLAPSSPIKKGVKEEALKQAKDLGLTPATSSEEIAPIGIDEALEGLAE